jgi:hypothetical protein
MTNRSDLQNFGRYTKILFKKVMIRLYLQIKLESRLSIFYVNYKTDLLLIYNTTAYSNPKKIC